MKKAYLKETHRNHFIGLNLIIEAARLSFHQIFSKEFRHVIWKSLGLTLLLFFAMWMGIDKLVEYYVSPHLAGWPWVLTILLWLLGGGIIIGAGFILAPTAAIFAGLFLDDVAEQIESKDYPQDESGKAIAIIPGIWMAVKFMALVIITNFIALMLVLIFGMGIIIFFVVNGYLLGREYFQFAAMRFSSESEAKALRKKHSLEVFMAGLIIALMISIPFINIFAPVFAAILMVHIHKALTGSKPAIDAIRS